MGADGARLPGDRSRVGCCCEHGRGCLLADTGRSRGSNPATLERSVQSPPCYFQSTKCVDGPGHSTLSSFRGAALPFISTM